MTRSLIGAAVLAALLFQLPVAAHAQTPGSAQYRGYAAIERLLASRVMAKGASFGLYLYAPSSLLSLLGAREGSGAERPFRNGVPNAVNMLIWDLAMTGLADGVGGLCADSQSMQTGPYFTRAFERLCKWPAAAARDEAALSDYWLALMGYDAPEEEFLAWRDFFLGPVYAQESPDRAVQAMTLAILMNPYFLLSH